MVLLGGGQAQDEMEMWLEVPSAGRQRSEQVREVQVGWRVCLSSERVNKRTGGGVLVRLASQRL